MASNTMQDLNMMRENLERFLEDRYSSRPCLLKFADKGKKPKLPIFWRVDITPAMLIPERYVIIFCQFLDYKKELAYQKFPRTQIFGDKLEIPYYSMQEVNRDSKVFTEVYSTKSYEIKHETVQFTVKLSNIAVPDYVVIETIASKIQELVKVIDDTEVFEVLYG